MKNEEWRVDADATLGEALRERHPEWKGATRKNWLARGRVHVNGQPVERANHQLRAGDRVALILSADGAAPASSDAAPGGAPCPAAGGASSSASFSSSSSSGSSTVFSPTRGSSFSTASASGPAGGGFVLRVDGAPPIVVRYADPFLVVIEKPAGLRSVSDDHERERTVPALLGAYLRSHRGRFPNQSGGPAEASTGGRPPPVGDGRSSPRERAGCWVVHRLDRDTSGLLVLARSRDIKHRLVADWDAVEKMYWAVTDGTPRPPSGRVDHALKEDARLFVRVSRSSDARPAVTDYRVAAEAGGRALVAVFPRTGRKHQIRVHLAARGAPLSGDRRYGRADGSGATGARMLLHAARLSFRHPATGRRMYFSTPYPADFPAVFASAASSATGDQAAKPAEQP